MLRYKVVNIHCLSRIVNNEKFYYEIVNELQQKIIIFVDEI